MSLTIVFAGTPKFAVPSLLALIDSEHTVVGVYTQPDRPAGRGRRVQPSPVKALAELHGIPVYQPKTLRDPAAQETLRALSPDIMVVVAYGLLLPEAVLNTPRLGCVNVHPSLLPKWRGAAPIQRTVEAGDAESGVTIMQLDMGMDTGPILKQASYALAGNESSAALHDEFSMLGAKLLAETIDDLASDNIIPRQQNDDQATHAAKISKQEAVIDWTLPAVVIANKVRAFNPWPVTQTVFAQQTLRIWSAEAVKTPCDLAPGTLAAVDKESFSVATGSGLLKICSVQLPGKNQMTSGEFVCGQGDALMIGKTQFGDV